MTEPAPSGGPSPLRVGGLALLGAGAVAALIGLATLLPGGGGGTAPTTTEAPSAHGRPRRDQRHPPWSPTVAADRGDRRRRTHRAAEWFRSVRRR